MPKVSVIMSVYNESIDQLEKSMQSILGQDFDDFEFIIVLDSPGNIKAKEYIMSQQKINQRIVFLENEKNIKLGASLNTGIAVAKGKYIARMDADDICDSRKFGKQVEYLEQSTKTDLLFTGWEEIDEQESVQVRIPSKKDFENISKTFFYKSPILHASMMCKREILEKHQYPEIDRPEDFSLFLDLIHIGYHFDVIEENLYRFFVHHQSPQIKYQKIRVFASNYLQILFKNIPRFWKNVYFWWMFFMTSIQWVLSRNRWIFGVFFEKLQGMYKKWFIN